MKRILVVMLTMVLLVTGCTHNVADEGQVSKSADYPITITDQIGREVIILEDPESIVSGYYISTSMLLALGQEEELVGVEKDAGKRNIVKLSAPQVAKLPTIGSAKEFDLEACAVINPDLLVIPAKLKDNIPSLEQLGIPTIVINPENQQLMEEAITILGKATNSSERAERLLAFADDKLNELENYLQNVEKPVVYLGGNSNLLSTTGAAMYQSVMIEHAGGTNAAHDITDVYWAEVSYEQILTWNPEYIILAAEAAYSADEVLTDTNLNDCKAIQNANVYQMPNAIEAWDSPIPASILGNLWMASCLHPEEYSKEKYEQAVIEFYEEFYEFTPEIPE